MDFIARDMAESGLKKVVGFQPFTAKYLSDNEHVGSGTSATKPLKVFVIQYIF